LPPLMFRHCQLAYKKNSIVSAMLDEPLNMGHLKYDRHIGGVRRRTHGLPRKRIRILFHPEGVLEEHELYQREHRNRDVTVSLRSVYLR
jgi:hypothetical protein